ncbi:MAG: DUF6524 family protein [Halieaceae bacterium]|jgi:hypothetical protein|nr:DUF6524 family protein [Halieaceae bacterium]
MTTNFGADSFLLRWIFALVLVLGTYNPSPFSYIGWLLADGFSFGPLPALVGVILVIGWIVFLRATFLSLGWLGVLLGVALFVCLIWLLVDIGLLSLESSGILTWLSLIVVSLLLGVGMSWSHIRRRLSGQVAVDDVETG